MTNNAIMKTSTKISLVLILTNILFAASAYSQETPAKQAVLDMEFSEVDSVKTVTVTAHATENGKEIPIAGETVTVFIPRMFSNFIVAELTLDDSGQASTEFPNDLPGGKDGNLIIVAAMINNSTYGNIEKRVEKHWGIPTDYLPTSHRALWTSRAPSWMIITLSVLLAGVWGHYFFAIISLIRIRRDAEREKAKAEYKA